jgi:hypothetical protein
MGLVSAFVATYANTGTDAPIYLCAALYIGMVCFKGHLISYYTNVEQALVAAIMPFEPKGVSSM